MRIAYARMNKLFDVIQYVTSEDYSSRGIPTRYTAVNLHADCGFSFTADWRVTARMNFYQDEGALYFCPRCGTQVIARDTDQHIRISNIYQTKTRGEQVPVDMELKVNEYKHCTDLVVECHVYECQHGEGSAPRLQRQKKRLRMVLRADIGRQELRLTYDRPGHDRTIVMPDPVADPDWPADTPLSYLVSSIGTQSGLLDLRDAFKAWRQSIERKLAEKLGYKVPSFYVAPGFGNYYATGYFHSVLRNIAWRLAAPTAPNYDAHNWHSFHRMMNESGAGGRFEAVWSDVLARTRAGQEYYAAVCDAAGLPNKPALRRALRADELFSAVPYYQDAWRITGDINHTAETAGRLRRWYQWSMRKTVFRFLRTVRYQYGTDYVMALLRMPDDMAVRDTARMYDRLDHVYRTALWRRPHIKRRDLHDAVLLLHDQQELPLAPIPHTPLDRVLPDTVGGFAFALADSTHDLIDISRELHNCVKSYAERVLRNQVTIVCVRRGDDIRACIEVHGRDIHQAKRDQRPGIDKSGVKNDDALNQAVLAWAARKHLAIKTNDIQKAVS